MRGTMRRRGDAWELRAYAGRDPVTGRKKTATKTFRGGSREAEEALAAFVTEVAGGGHAVQDATMGDLLHRWFDMTKGDLSPSTAREYERIIKVHILPTFGKVPVARLRTAQLDAFYAKLRDGGGKDGKPLSPATVRQVHAVLRRALRQAVRWEWITTNPAIHASPPRVTKPHLQPPSPDDVVELIAVADEYDADFGCYLRVAATTGARRGELCALRWRDVDFDAPAVTISHSIAEGRGLRPTEKDTKTHSARRIALDTLTVSALKKHRKKMESRAKTCTTTVCEDGFIFSRDPDGARPWPPNDVTKWFIAARAKAGKQNVRLHDFRHFAATRLLAAGVPVRTVSGRLGHANAATTLGVYAHFVEESDRDAADILGELVGRGKKG